MPLIAIPCAFFSAAEEVLRHSIIVLDLKIQTVGFRIWVPRESVCVQLQKSVA